MPKHNKEKQHMTKVRNGDLIAAFEALEGLSQQKMNMEAALRLRRVKRNLEGVAKDVAELRGSLISEYGEGGTINQLSPRWAEFVPQYNELMLSETEVPNGVTLNPEDLWRRGAGGDRESLDIEPVVLDALDRVGVLGEPARLLTGPTPAD
jgi:hypothetical protein